MPLAKTPPMKPASTRKLAMPESSGNTSSCLSSISTRKLCLASAQPLAKRLFFGAVALGATSAVFGGESKPQRRQRATSWGMRLVQFGHFFMASPCLATLPSAGAEWQ